MKHRTIFAVGVRLAVATLCSTPLAAQADSNSIFLINATNGPIDAYTGTGIVIGQLESGVPNTNHLFLLGRVQATTNIIAGTSGALTAHATEVAGVMVSTDAVVRGVAPGATLTSAGVAGGTVLQKVDTAYLLATQFMAKVINQSHGGSLPPPGSSGTSVWERALDRLVLQTASIFVVAVDNSGPGAQTLGEPEGAFNVISVGAVNNARSGTATNVATYSGRGYTADGRSKPDLVAPGGCCPGTATNDNVQMPTDPAGTPAVNTTTSDAGTSFAAPHVAGTVARLLQAGSGGFANTNAAASQDPRVIKAALLNAATKLPGWSQQNTVTNAGIIVVDHPLDPNQGAGLLNANKSLLQLQAGRYAPTVVGTGPAGNAVPLKGWDLFSVSLSLTNFYRLDTQVVGEMRLTLDWYRDIGPTQAGTNEFWGLSNLDLHLWRSADDGFTNLTLVAQSVSLVDNVEHLYFTNLTAGWYQFGVSYTNYVKGIDATPLGTVYGLAWDFTAIPEPSTLLLATLGLAIVCRLRRRRPPSG